ncbi:Uncharacterised protein [Shigella sonnei]|nr:Uncharacterised protein [Shigella sonnei]
MLWPVSLITPLISSSPTRLDIEVNGFNGGVDFDTPWCQPESDVVAELSRRFGCTLEHWYAEQGCNFCGWQLYERGELVDVLWGELEWSSPTDDDELPEVTGPAWIIDNVAHYGG